MGQFRETPYIDPMCNEIVLRQMLTCNRHFVRTQPFTRLPRPRYKETYT